MVSSYPSMQPPRSRKWILWPFGLFLLILSIHFSTLIRSSVRAEYQQAPATVVAVMPASPTATIAPPTQTPTETAPTATPTATPTSTAPPTSTAEPTSTPTLEPGASRVSPIDGMVKVYIPAGEFNMGVNGGAKDQVNQPMHKVYLDAYWIAQTTITNAMYKLCVEAGGCTNPIRKELNPHYYDPAYANHPAVYIVWLQAEDYCKWSGGRLPTEAEWEKAARGTGKREYPWGSGDPNPNRVNVNHFHETTVRVGRYPKGASPYGVLDMGSNVREWVADWYQEDYYKAGTDNPTGPKKGDAKVLRGASWFDPLYYAKVTNRLSHPPNSAGWNRGFRCVYEQ